MNSTHQDTPKNCLERRYTDLENSRLRSSLVSAFAKEIEESLLPVGNSLRAALVSKTSAPPGRQRRPNARTRPTSCSSRHAFERTPRIRSDAHHDEPAQERTSTTHARAAPQTSPRSTFTTYAHDSTPAAPPTSRHADFFLKSLDPTLFPGLSSSIKAHSGFADEQAKTAANILAAVNTALAAHSATEVTMVGHGLGGKQTFADHASIGGTVTHINNKFVTSDIAITAVSENLETGQFCFARAIFDGMIRIAILGVPERSRAQTLPTGIFARIFMLTSIVGVCTVVYMLEDLLRGRIPSPFFQDSGAWDSCPGEDNNSPLCSAGDVPNILEGDERDHDGSHHNIHHGVAWTFHNSHGVCELDIPAPRFHRPTQ
ncbi:hypothetical protein DFH09DRAFT_1092493 [Mycena vulgaris]|nr:hypothetical protein DFH09DRAFT_1092493 [Mycena vulgaris]